MLVVSILFSWFCVFLKTRSHYFIQVHDDFTANSREWPGRDCTWVEIASTTSRDWGDMTTSVGHTQPRRHLDKLEGRLVYWRMFHHPMLHRLPSTLGEPGLGNLFLPTHIFTSSSGSISRGSSWFLSPSPQKAQKREPRDGEIASSNCSGAGLVDKRCQSHQVCLTGPPHQRLTWLQGTEATGRESVNLCCRGWLFPELVHELA